tara:strand:+ start:2082 stop:2504 length:423 start_codon:yes stop_codon:yes gene_type:complete
LTDKDEIALEDGGEKLPLPVTGGLPRGAGRVAALSALLLVPAVAAFWLTDRQDTAVGILGGGIVAIGNFWFLARIVVVATGRETMEIGAMMGRLFAKFLVLGASLGFLVLVLRLDGFGVLLGVGVVFPAIVLASLMDVLN